MTFFSKLPFKFPPKQPQNNSGINQSIQSQPKTLAELEKELEAQLIPTYPHKPTPQAKAKGGLLGKIKWTVILVGVPLGIAWVIVWLANQPDPIIRSYVAQQAPILLLPSYRSMESEYKQALASVQQAEQLVNNATSPADLELGEQKVKEAQKHLDALPLNFLTDWPGYNYWWYDWRFSVYAFNAAREKIGQLDAKVFQEKNAQTSLVEGEQALNKAKQQYQQVSTTTDKQAAIASWKSALDQLEQIPSTTLAGKTAEKKLEAETRDFKDMVGLAAGNERISALIEASRQFSWQAAKSGENPPHSIAQWQQVENLWQEAINRVEQIPSQDLTGYAEAQKILAEDKANLEDVKVRKQAEADSEAALDQAQSQITSLQASIPKDSKSVNRNLTISQLQAIIFQLEKVQSGTTVYLKAQELLLYAKNKLNQL